MERKHNFIEEDTHMEEPEHCQANQCVVEHSS